jgi:bacterioferritin (cytochrome b1)
MTGDPKVIKALNELVALEITVHEVGHGWEKVWECAGYKGLRKFWDDKVVGKSRIRRRYLEKRIVRFEGQITVTLQTATIDPATKAEAALAGAMKAVMNLLNAYRSAWKAVSDAGDNTTADDLCDLQKSVEATIFKLESWARQISDIDIKLWLAQQV